MIPNSPSSFVIFAPFPWWKCKFYERQTATKDKRNKSQTTENLTCVYVCFRPRVAPEV